MTKFLNKKEQVFDLKLTTYGHYLMSIGKFKPVYYTFCDDNVLYDGEYAGFSERQNDVHDRIKYKTPYLEGLVLFEDVEDLVIEEGASEINFYSSDITPLEASPRKDKFRMSAMIGDGFTDGGTEKAPGWKIAMLQGQISGSTQYDDTNSVYIPQLNIDVYYLKKIIDNFDDISPENIRALSARTSQFIDGKIIVLEAQDPIIYMEEMNTQLLSENFDIEVCEILTGSDSAGKITTRQQRKYFIQQVAQIQNGLLLTDTPVDTAYTIGASIGTEASENVEYYFNVLADHEIEDRLACRGALQFNKESYYVDLDFDCDSLDLEEAESDLFYDIYGSETEPEVCQ